MPRRLRDADEIAIIVHVDNQRLERRIVTFHPTQDTTHHIPMVALDALVVSIDTTGTQIGVVNVPARYARESTRCRP